MRVLVLTLILAAAAFSSNIANSPHNLSVTGPGTIKAVSETEICVFCHIPHHEEVGVPLWNHLLSSASYTLYDSEFIQRVGYPPPQQLSLVEGQPGIVSRMCLSCHDGTVAIGAVYWVRGTNLFDIGQTIEMVGVNPDGTMPTTEEGYIGTDLRTHHPVAIEYRPGTYPISAPGGTISKNIELRSPEPTPPIKLYDYGGVKYVECTSCHDPHKYDTTVNRKFLRIDTGATFGENVVATCIACHDRNIVSNWSSSAHATATNTYSDPDVLNKYGVNTVASLECLNCHTPHKGQGVPYLLRWAEEATCFQGAASASNLSACHGTGANNTKVIEPFFGLPYKHPVTTVSGIHTNLDVLYGTGNPPQPQGSKGITFDSYKHAECVDCHNPHKTAPGNHAEPADTRDTVNAGWYPQNPSNTVSNVLQGVTGVMPTWTGPGTQPTTYTVLENASAEYQICIKCHSYWALGTATQWVSAYTFSDSRTLLDGTPYKLTDVAAEFNPNNASGHPVVVSANNRSGSYAPRALPPETLREPWRSNVGNVTMYCSDCHGAENEAGGDPRGPHGSSVKFMLKGPGKFWPDKNGNFFTPGGIRSGSQNVNDLFCNNCHDIPWIMNNVSPHNSNINAMEFAACVECHVAIPHGSPVSRLLGYCWFPDPYNYKDASGNYMLKLWGWRKDYNGGNWNLGYRRDAWTEHVDCGGNRGMCHGYRSGSGQYDCYTDSPFVSDCGQFNPPNTLPSWCY